MPPEPGCLSVGQGIVQAFKADALSITSWQVGMYGLMAICQFVVLRPLFGNIAPEQPGILVCHAAVHAGRVRHQLSGELAADPKRSEGKDVGDSMQLPKRLFGLPY
jgi:hypothetical protein